LQIEHAQTKFGRFELWNIQWFSKNRIEISSAFSVIQKFLADFDTIKPS